MIRHIYSLVCSKAIIDRTTNNMTMVEVIEGLLGPNDPPAGGGILAVQMDLITLWTRSNLAQAEQGRAKVQLLAPNGAPIGDPLIYTVDLNEFVRTRNITRFGGMPFNGPGTYNFAIERETDGAWQEVARYPLEVTVEAPIIPVEAAAPPAGAAQ